MPINNNLALLNRKEWQMMTPAPVLDAVGMFMVASDSGNFNIAMYVTSATVQYLYHHDEDSFALIASGGLAGAFGAGACGVFHPWSRTYTANGGTVNTITVAAASFNITGIAVNSIVEFLSAAGSTGYRRKITAIDTTGGGVGNITLTLDSAVPVAIANGHTFRLTTGRFYILNAYASLAAGVFKVFDVATLTWLANLGTTNLPAAWGTDGKLCVAYNFGEITAVGIATSGGASVLNNTTKNWTAGQWRNYQIRITGGTGIGQTRTISDNTTTQITVASAWATNPDATSTYEITANEDYLYLMGNAAVTMYRYSISADTWTVMSPTTARAAAPAAGMGAVCVGKCGDAAWADETNIKDGRYIYSPRGTSTAIDRFDIAGGAAGAGAWQALTYAVGETFGAGSSFFALGRYMYMRKDATHRFFKYSFRGNYIEPVSFNFYTDGVALVGNKLWGLYLPETIPSDLVDRGFWDVNNTYQINDIVFFDQVYYKCIAVATGITQGVDNPLFWEVYQDNQIKWLYSLRNTGTEIHRLMLF